MTKIKSLIILFSLLLLLASCATRKSIYVSPMGNDKAEGSKDDPVKNIDAAMSLVNKYTGGLPITIYFDGGNYNLESPIQLNKGGTKNAPILWKAVPGKKPVISGGVSINNWKMENENLWSAKLPDEINNKFRSFYINDRRATRARFPDSSYLRIEKSGEDRRTNFFFHKNDIPYNINTNGLELVFLHDWSITRIAVKSIDWKNNRLTAVDSIGARLPFFNIDNWEKQPRYYLENSLQFCDSPGEWFCDFDERKIYYFPQDGEEIDNIKGEIPITPQLIKLNGQNGLIENISFEDLTFAYSSFTIPEKGYCGIQACKFTNRLSNNIYWDDVSSAIEIKSAKNIMFKNCIFKHMGGSAILIGSKSYNCSIEQSQIFDISGNGINIGEGRNRLVNDQPWWKSAPSEASTNNIVENSIIKGCGKEFFGAVGIWCGLVSKTKISNNEVVNLPYTGISIGWMWDTTATPCRENIITSNHIHNIMNILSDGGGIYSLGLQPGSLISNNLIHDVKINAGRAESNGMFLDEGTRDVIVDDNIIYNIAKSPLRFHKAFNNRVVNNVLTCRNEDIPPIRYNNTKKENIEKINNILLYQSISEDKIRLNSILNKNKNKFGPQKRL